MAGEGDSMEVDTPAAAPAAEPVIAATPMEDEEEDCTSKRALYCTVPNTSK